jgi:hypothetical protein
MHAGGGDIVICPGREMAVTCLSTQLLKEANILDRSFDYALYAEGFSTEGTITIPAAALNALRGY